MLNRNILNGKHELIEDEWILSFVRRTWNAHGYLIIEGLDQNGIPVRKRAELSYMEIGINKKGQMEFDGTRGQIYYYDLSNDKVELMSKEQNEYVCKIFVLNTQEKTRLVTKIEADQQRDIPYNVGGNTKSSGFFGASLAASGSHKLKADLTLSAQDRVRDDKSCAQVSLAVLKEGHNCISWAEETIEHANPALDIRTGFAKYVVVLPQLEIGTKCVIL